MAKVNIRWEVGKLYPTTSAGQPTQFTMGKWRSKLFNICMSKGKLEQEPQQLSPGEGKEADA